MPQTVHATLVARHLGGWGWRGVLLVGASGAGKSDLALRLLGRGWRLAADDRVLVWRSGGRAFGRAPQALAGLLELRGQAVLPVPALPFAEIALVARLGPPPERQPEAAVETVAGVGLAAIDLAAFEASAPERLRRIVERTAARL